MSLSGRLLGVQLLCETWSDEEYQRVKLFVDIEGANCSVNFQTSGESLTYQFEGDIEAAGSASVTEISPGVFSVLLEAQSFTVRIEQKEGKYEVWSGSRQRTIRLSDVRDRAANAKGAAAVGPQELRAQMPGKIVKVLVDAGTSVEMGQGLLVIEAMKMQNELKSSKPGRVAKIYVSEGVTVAAGESLLLIE